MISVLVFTAPFFQLFCMSESFLNKMLGENDLD